MNVEKRPRELHFNYGRLKLTLPNPPKEQTIVVAVMVILSTSMTEEASAGKACPRGLFLLDRAPTTSPPFLMSSSSSVSSTRLCVQVCPLGYYSTIVFKSKPSFSDLNAGSANRHASLQCLPCKPKCTACLGPRPSSCFVCDPQWVQDHKSAFEHESQRESKSNLNSTFHNCQVWETISSRQQRREFNEKNGKKSLGTVALLVVLSAMFSAVIVFSIYRLHWEKRHQGNRGTLSEPSFIHWFSRCWERKNYSAISTQGNSERAMWTNTEEESIIFSSDNLESCNVK